MSHVKFKHIDHEALEAYARDGVICLRGVIDAAWIDTLRSGVEKNLVDPGPHVERYTRGGDPCFLADFDLWRRVPEMHDFLFQGPCAEMAGLLMGSSQVHLFYDHLWIKEPGTRGRTPWHQDQPYMAVNGLQLCSTWIPLDIITWETSVEFIKGSHRWGQWFAPFDALTDGTVHPSTVFMRCPDIESNRDQYTIDWWDMEPGDCLIMHSLVLHQGRDNPNKSRRRRAISYRWLGDDAVYTKRDPPAEFPKDEAHLQEGEPMSNSPLFPLIWKRPRSGCERIEHAWISSQTEDSRQ